MEGNVLTQVSNTLLCYKIRKRAKNKKKTMDEKIKIKVCYEHCCETRLKLKSKASLIYVGS